MNEINIRPVTESDNATLAQIIRSVFEEHDAPQTGSVYSDAATDDLFGIFKTKRSALWVAEINDSIVGCCGVYPTEGLAEDCVELVKFYISPGARGKGIGKALMEKSIACAKQFGYSKIYLESFPNFSDAIVIYEKQGFERLDKPLGNSGHTSCNIWMIKKL